MIIIQDFLYFGFHPIAWIFYSGLFFNFITKKFELAKTVLCLNCYCIFMMPFAIEALIRGMISLRSLGAGYLKIVIFSYLAISILLLCFFLFALATKFINLLTYNVYIYFALILFATMLIFPRVSVPLAYAISLQVVTVWGLIATALYGLWEYTVPSNVVTTLQKNRILMTMLLFCMILTLCEGTKLYKYEKSRQSFLSMFSATDATSISNRSSFDNKELRDAISHGFEIWCDSPGNVTFVLGIANLTLGLDRPPEEVSYTFDVSLFTPDGRLFERQKVDGTRIFFPVSTLASDTPMDYIGKWRMKVHEAKGVTPRQVLIAICIDGLHQLTK
jgi:hypothetical protein